MRSERKTNMIWITSNRRQIKSIVLLGLIAVYCLSICGCSQGQADEEIVRADIINIDNLAKFGSLERPPVAFPHDAHTIALIKQNKDCKTCHLLKKNGELSQKYFRLEDINKDAVMEIYHENCVDCHQRTTDSGLEAGPTACGNCHLRKPVFQSSWQPIGFDKSLHHRHITASDKNCSLCHHNYNDKTDKLYYAKGEESSCRDCHRVQEGNHIPSLSQAAHQSCLGCHLKTDDSGPIDCAGCHDLQRQMEITVVENPIRLKRNQPDFMLLSATENELTLSKMNTVPFSHEGHEIFNSTCRVCHHESMNSCTDCHTIQGNPESKGVNLQQAFHDMSSDHSCIGCHEKQKSKNECAGCHSLMEQGRFSKRTCPTCHSGPHPENLKRAKTRYTSLSQFKPDSKDVRLSFKEKDIPEIVTISVLSDKYEPAVFPHRQIVKRLLDDINDNRIAEYFHGHDDVVCQGCHHNSPIGERPPLCRNCHGEPFNEADMFKPGLMGAYHQQCLDCHKNMEIKEPSDCVGCHAIKQQNQQ